MMEDILFLICISLLITLPFVLLDGAGADEENHYLYVASPNRLSTFKWFISKLNQHEKERLLEYVSHKKGKQVSSCDLPKVTYLLYREYQRKEYYKEIAILIWLLKA